MQTDLDAVDIKILDLMQRDASLSTSEISDRVGLSQSPCWRRIQRLREEGYITSQVALVNKRKVGLNMQIFAQVKMKKLTDDERASFVKSVREIPEIQECYAVFGEMDIILKVLAPDVNWYQDFVFSTIMKLPGVESIQSIVTLSEMKCSTAVSLRQLSKR